MKTPEKVDIASEISAALCNTVETVGLAPEEILETVARTLVERCQTQRVEGFDLVFSRVEHFIIWSSPDLRQWLIVNFLEVLKNVST